MTVFLLDGEVIKNVYRIETVDLDNGLHLELYINPTNILIPFQELEYIDDL